MFFEGARAITHPGEAGRLRAAVRSVADGRPELPDVPPLGSDRAMSEHMPSAWPFGLSHARPGTPAYGAQEGEFSAPAA